VRRLAADAAAAAPKELTQEIVRLKGGAAAHKEAALLALCARTFSGGRTIVFAKTKQRAHRWGWQPGAAIVFRPTAACLCQHPCPG
jgi:superfamily II DNA/RNA helicase